MFLPVRDLYIYLNSVLDLCLWELPDRDLVSVLFLSVRDVLECGHVMSVVYNRIFFEWKYVFALYVPVCYVYDDGDYV